MLSCARAVASCAIRGSTLRPGLNPWPADGDMPRKEPPLLSTSRLRSALRTPPVDSALSTAHAHSKIALAKIILAKETLAKKTPGASAAGRALRGHKKAVAALGVAAAVATGAGAAGAAAVSGPAASLPAALHPASGAVAGVSWRPDSGLPSMGQDSLTTPVSLPSANQAAAAVISASRTPAATGTSGHPATATAAGTPAHPAAAPAAPAAPAPAPANTPLAPAAPARPSLSTWSGIEDAAANQGAGSPVAVMNNPLPIGVTAAQSQLPMNGAQWQNATTIVQQALDKGMGLRSAVIAVATAMQESQLININYGTYDSLGLFQQRPSAGWGTAAQVTNPVYAADAFLDALHSYQVSNPDWATQPVWQPAQAVQNSAYPYAYGQWEVQAAQIVMGCARNLL
jgi:hypothetical protein